jgi:hypothetical protein
MVVNTTKKRNNHMHLLTKVHITIYEVSLLSKKEKGGGKEGKRKRGGGRKEA